MPRGTQVKRDGLLITVGRRGVSSGIALRHLRHPLAPCPVCKGPHLRRDCPQSFRPQGVGLSGQSGPKVPGGPHTSFHPNNTQGTPGINNCGAPISWSSFGHCGNFLCAHWSPWSTFLLIHYCNGTVRRNQTYYFSHPLSCNWDYVLFSNEFLTMPESPSLLLGRDILSKDQASVFINMEPSLLTEQNVNPKVWADGKTLGRTQNAVPVVIKLKDPHLFPHQKQYPLKLKVKEGLWLVRSLGKTLLAFALLHFVLQGQISLLLQVFLDFLLFPVFFF